MGIFDKYIQPFGYTIFGPVRTQGGGLGSIDTGAYVFPGGGGANPSLGGVPDPRLDRLQDILTLLQQRIPTQIGPVGFDRAEIDSGIIPVGQPFVFQIGTSGQIKRMRFINSFPSDFYLQIVSGPSLASAVVVCEEFIAAKQPLIIDDYSGSPRNTQPFWLRVSTTHRNYEPILSNPAAFDAGFLTGEIVISL